MESVKKSFVSTDLFNHPVVLQANLYRLEERTVKCVIKKTALCDLPSFGHISWDTNERSITSLKVDFRARTRDP